MYKSKGTWIDFRGNVVVNNDRFFGLRNADLRIISVFNLEIGCKEDFGFNSLDNILQISRSINSVLVVTGSWASPEYQYLDLDTLEIQGSLIDGFSRVWQFQEVLQDDRSIHICGLSDSEGNSLISVIDGDSLKPLFTYQKRRNLMRYLIAHEGKIISLNNDHEIWCQKFDDLEVQWGIDFQTAAPETDFKKFIGTHSSLLLIALTQNTIIALDIETGQLVDKWQDERMAPELMALHTESGKLVGLCGYNYIEIDVMTKELHCISMEEHFKREQVIAMNIGQSHLDGKNIIFSSLGSDMNPFGKSKLAAFDIQSQQVVWQHEFPIPKRRPQVQDGRIFVVDDNKVLHVFEREDRQEVA